VDGLTWKVKEIIDRVRAGVGAANQAALKA
jgi:hypothetical protein